MFHSIVSLVGGELWDMDLIIETPAIRRIAAKGGFFALKRVVGCVLEWVVSIQRSFTPEGRGCLSCGCFMMWVYWGGLEVVFEVLAGVGGFGFGDLFWGALGDDVAAFVAAFGAEVD